MTVLVDTNIILDLFLEREPYTDAARIIITKCAEREVIGYLAAHSIPNLFYILRKRYTPKERRELIRNLDDYRESRVKVVEPDEFVKMLQNDQI